MKELTVTMNAQITFIADENGSLSEENIRESVKRDMEMVIKSIAGADDVVVSDLKLFIMDKEEADDPFYNTANQNRLNQAIEAYEKKETSPHE